MKKYFVLTLFLSTLSIAQTTLDELTKHLNVNQKTISVFWGTDHSYSRTTIFYTSPERKGRR